MTRKTEVVVAGELYVDLILSGFDNWPQAGQEAFAREFRREMGGGVAITACGLAKLGVQTTVLAVVGSEDGLWLKNRLIDCGVDTVGLQFEAAEPTGFSVVASTPHDRTFLTYPGANRKLEQVLQGATAAHRISSARHTHLAYAPRLDDAVTLIEQMRAGGCSLSLDTGWHEEWLEDARAMEVIRHLDIYFPNEMEANRLTGETEPAAMLQEFQKAGCRCVALKLGRHGSALLLNGTITFAPPLAVTAIDTTGAGDCFNAGFLHAWLGGGTPGDCLLTANICGALSTEAYGGIEGFPSRERLQRELAKKGQA